MIESNYTKIYTGNFIITQLIVDRLQEKGISAVVKDESESGRLAGFMASIQGQQELYVNNEELDDAVHIAEEVLSETKV